MSRAHTYLPRAERQPRLLQLQLHLRQLQRRGPLLHPDLARYRELVQLRIRGRARDSQPIGDQ